MTILIPVVVACIILLVLAPLLRSHVRRRQARKRLEKEARWQREEEEYLASLLSNQGEGNER